MIRFITKISKSESTIVDRKYIETLRTIGSKFVARSGNTLVAASPENADFYIGTDKHGRGMVISRI